eukprot:TRINITY_DN5513_c0_g4_i1.p1 TRINITY_DN5513_c0_g4~~TRINITY_DN5513_c0_g4_i1.p1  ORF type:complete len:1186 (+),score=204.94 TRINITY_DN5513_c0_g4_i1:40-3597(+)
MPLPLSTMTSFDMAISALERELDAITKSTRAMQASVVSLVSQAAPTSDASKSHELIAMSSDCTEAHFQHPSSAHTAKAAEEDDTDTDSDAEIALPQVLRNRWAAPTRKSRGSMTLPPICPAPKADFASRSKHASTRSEGIQQKLKVFGFWEEIHSQASKDKVTYFDAMKLGKISKLEDNQDLVDQIRMERQNAAWSLRYAFLVPTSLFHMIWAGLGFMVLMAEAICLPVSFAWDWSPDDTLPLLVPSAIYWTMDILVTLFTGYYEKAKLVTTLIQIFKHYLKSWLFFDLFMCTVDIVMLLVATSPYEGIGSSMNAMFSFRGARIIRLIRFIRMFRLLKLSSVAGRLQMMYMGRQYLELLVGVFQTFFILMLAIHILGCFHFFVGKLSVEEGATTNWIREYSFNSSDAWDQYLVSFHWVLGQFTPAPMNIQPQNGIERAYTVFVILFALVVVGSSISRISATLQQVMKLSAEAESKRRAMRQYLKINRIDMELAARVLLFVNHKLGKQKEVLIDRTLLSEKLVKELNMARRGPLLQRNPFFKLFWSAFPEVFVELCCVIKSQIHEQGDEIFSIGTMAPKMFIVQPGVYMLRYAAGKKEVVLEEMATFYAELSLFAPYIHDSTLACRSFADVFSLNGSNFADCLRGHPASGTFVYQYAISLLARMNSGKVEPSAELSHEVRELAYSVTDVYQILHMDEAKILANFTIGAAVNMVTVARLEELLMKLDKSEYTASDLCEDLMNMFPEIAPDVGTHASFSSAGEQKRALAAMTSILFLVKDQYNNFIQPQTSHFLLDTSWDALQDFVHWTGIRESMMNIQIVLTFLAIKGLGKSETLLLQHPKEYQGADMAVIYTVTNLDNLAPSVDALSEEGRQLLIDMLFLHKDFHLGQFLQAECSPASVAELATQEEDSTLVKITLFAALGMMCGIAGDGGEAQPCAHHGSKFMTEQNSTFIVMGLKSLQCIEERTCHEVYWSYISKRARLLNLQLGDQSSLAFARLACLTRVQSPSSRGLDALRLLWASLDVPDRNILINHLLADGINESTITFLFLPQCIVNAMQNQVVGLGSFMLQMIPLIEMARAKLILHDRGSFCDLRVNLSDLAQFVLMVKSKSAFESFLEHVEWAQRDSGVLHLSMTSQNWSRVDDPDSLAMGVSTSLRFLMRKQRSMQKCMDSVQEKLDQISPVSIYM